MTDAADPDATMDLRVDRMATGGAGIALGPDGRIVFVDGGVPGDRVEARTTEREKRFHRAVVTSVLEASPLRVEPTCSAVAAGCGGCDWQHLSVAGQHEQRRRIVVDSLRRLGRIEGVPVVAGPSLDPWGYRTMVRAAVVDGRAGFRHAGSHDVVVPERCHIAHPVAEALLRTGRFPGAREIEIKIGARTGDALVIVTPTSRHIEVSEEVAIIGRDELDAGAEAWLHEEIAGQRLRISADSFFQIRPDGAEALATVAGRYLADAPDGPMLDAYCGGGLFGAVVGQNRDVTGVESNPSSVRDARVNLGSDARVVQATVESWRPSPMAVVVADPSRRGLARQGVAVLAATQASHLVLVSCDPASLARDARLLLDAGYRLDEVTVLDLFAQTSHIETVARFVR